MKKLWLILTIFDETRISFKILKSVLFIYSQEEHTMEERK